MKRFPPNSLRGQLLLWISLPVLVALLTFALAGVQGHSQAMHELVQTRANGQVRAAAALIAIHIGHSQNTLERLSVMPPLHHPKLDAAAAKAALLSIQDDFERGLVLYQDGRPLVATNAGNELDADIAATLVRRVAESQTGALATLQVGDAWLLLHAVPITVADDSVRRVLLGAVPLERMQLPILLRSLALDSPSELVLTDTESRTLLTLRQEADDERMNADNSVLAVAGVEPFGWQVQLRESWTTWIPPVLRFGNMLSLALLAAATLSVLSAYYGLQQIVYPLQRLNRAVSSLGQGNFEAVQQPVGGVEEVAELQLALASMAQEVRRYQQELQRYIGAITLGQEEERKRVARELHDETVQSLIALNQQVEMAERNLSRDSQRAAERLRELRPLIGETIAGIRRQIQDLRPLYLEDLGFVPAVELLVQQTATQHGLMGDFEVTGKHQRPLPSAMEISGYRIVQESLKNVINHTQASWVHVELIFDADALVLRIEDDGQGFDVPSHLRQLTQVQHYGLLGMSERARLHGGELCIESERGSGTTVTARLPAPMNLQDVTTEMTATVLTEPASWTGVEDDGAFARNHR